MLSKTATVRSGVSISTGYRTITGKKLSYVCFTMDAVIQCEVNFFCKLLLKIQKHFVSIDFSCSGFSFHEHFNRQFTYGVFFIFKTPGCALVKRFYSNTLSHFWPVWDSFLTENILYVVT